MSDIIQEAKSIMSELEKKNQLQQQRIGQREAVLGQLKELGFDSLEEAQEALEILNAEHKENLEKIEKTLEAARKIIGQ